MRSITITKEEFDNIPIVSGKKECLANETSVTRYKAANKVWCAHANGEVVSLNVVDKSKKCVYKNVRVGDYDVTRSGDVYDRSGSGARKVTGDERKRVLKLIK